MSACPKCGYERQDQDDQFTPAGECPRCGIVYTKFWQAEMQYRSANAANQSHASQHVKIQNGGKRGGGVAVFVCILLIAATSYMAYRHYFSKPNEASKPWGVLYSEASNLFNEGRYSEALPHANLALSKAEQEKKPDQKKILEVMKLVAGTYERLGEHEQCVDSLERLKEKQEKTWGPDHQEVITTMDKLSSAYRRLGNDEKANSLIHDINSISERKTASAAAVANGRSAGMAVQSSYSDNAPTTAPERQVQYGNQSPRPSDCARLEDIYIKCRAYKCNLVKQLWTLGAEQFCNDACSQYHPTVDYSELKERLYSMGCYNEKDEYCRFALRRHYELRDPYAQAEYKMKGCADK